MADASFVFSLRNTDAKMQVADFNGDGMVDYVVSYNGQIEIAYSQGNFADILVKVDNGIGASTEFYYKPSSSYTNRRSDGTPGLPFVIPVFYQDKISDGQGNIYTTTYDYLSGFYDAEEKEFAGFGFCRITDQEGNYAEKFFRQDKDLHGRIYRETVRDKDKNIFASIESTWDKRELYAGVNLVYLKQRDDFTYDGDVTFRQRRINSEYDNYGNPTRIIDSGDVSLTGDEKTQVFEYNYNTLNNIVILPSRIYIQDADGIRIQEKRFYYDGANDCTTAPLKGLLTKEESWLYNSVTSSKSWLATSYKYDTLGNLIETIDPLGRTSKTEYDNVLRILPVKTINALGQATLTTYNFGTANPLTVTDANSQTATYQYDLLGRLIAVIGPLDSAQYPGITYAYNQTSRPTIVTTQKRIQPLTAAMYVSYQFYDGLGRVIQTKTPVASNKYVISDIVKFDSQGRKKETYLPYYVTTTSAAYSLPDYSQPRTIFEYDCMGRTVKITNPDGTYSQNTYSGWTTTAIDENGHQSQRVLDAHGRTIQVMEYNGSQIYTTTYEYDALGNLVRVTDDQGNQIVFAYDSLGRKLWVNDPDMGIWQYEYDAVGNLTRQTDAKGQALLFEYDALNRVIFKKGLSPQGTVPDTLSTYAYDNVAKGNCIGRLSKVTDPSGSSEYFYDKTGRKIKEIKTVDAAPFTTEYTYDSLDRLFTLKYPDATLIKYEYTVQGTTKLANITNPSIPVNYLSASEFSATNQITKNTFGNNVVTNYVYNAKNLRLAGIVTQNTQRKLQDLQYSFDNAGNISRIKDNLNTATQDFIYDGLNRLTQATGAYGVLTYNYDSLGNMLNKEGVGFVYGQGHVRPHALFYASDGSQFSYDDNGSLSEEYAPSRGKVKYSYNLENRLVKVEPKEQARQEFTFTLRLNPGWNLFSLPIIPKDSDILQVLKNLRSGSDYDQVARYNSASKTWEMFSNQPEFDQFSTIEYGRGYQIYVTNSAGATLTVQGYLSSTESEFPVSAGWNLVCYPYVAASVAVETALRPLSLGADYDTVEQYNSTTAAVEKYTANQKQFTELKQGKAYYVRALKDAKWKVPAQNTASSSLAGAVEQNDFIYDYSGERVKKTTPKGATVYIGNIFEKCPDGTTRLHVFSGSNRIATITKGLPPAGSLPEVIYYHPDHLGSSNVISDKNSNQVQLSEYTPFGSFSPGRLPPAASRISHYFTGKELDSSGLYNYGARYYHSRIAHFTQPDPLIQNIYDPQSLNHYAYCRNNPLVLVDPSGMFWNSPSWGGFGNWFSGGWNSFCGGFSSVFSFGITTIGRWGMQINGFMGSQASAWGDFFGSTSSIAFRGLSDFGQSAWNESRIWGSALGMGFNYAFGHYGSGLNQFSLINADVNRWTDFAKTSRLDAGPGPKLQIVFKDIPFTFGLGEHTYLRITGYPKAGDISTWGFNPNPFSPGVLLGTSVPGRVSTDKEWSMLPITISTDLTIIKQVYNIAEQLRNSSTPNYTLYGSNIYNCYSWRNQVLREAGFPVESWGN
ncbi:MAG: DUF6443 domain-containing protein [Candidatus Omnitrophica bacterium]|nr:DUF6443 domain-containing protein [Candidatus Omnitrophota bacterium]